MTTPKYHAIASELSQTILTGQLAAGDKLPPHRVLAKRLGVTTGTVSRAYASLERRGLATARVGDGTYVRYLDAGALSAGPDADQAPIDLAYNVAIPTDEPQALLGVFEQLRLDPERLAELLRYQPEAGMARHRRIGADWLRRFGTGGDWHRVMVTHGAQHALAGVLRTIARPGDTLLTESLTYPGLLTLARSLRLQVIGVAMDDEGLLPDALDRAAQTFQGKLLFCSPTLHNPTTSTMGRVRREAIAAVVQRHGLFLLEDVVHAAVLREPPPAISSLVPEQSFLMASLSKVLAPGLRVGFLEASPAWLDKVAASIRADCWMVAPLMPEIATQWLSNGEAQRLIALQRQQLAERQQTAHPLLAGLDYRWQPEHPHLWLPLPEPWTSQAFAAALRQQGVLVRTSDQFAAGRTTAPRAIRISLNSARNLDQLAQGLATVRRLLHSGDPGTLAH